MKLSPLSVPTLEARHPKSWRDHAAQQSVQLTVGTRRVFRHFRAFGFFRFDGESTLPPTAANASR